MNGALMSTSNTTQAGIYQKVRQDSVAIMVDEMEAKEDTRTTDKILELARIAYSGDKMQRGGKDGVGRSSR
jgi:stalled ribosome rescue protein Dom34